MNIDGTYRVLLLAIFLFSTMTAGYHRYQATSAGGPISRREEGRLQFWAIRLSGLLLFGLTLLYLTFPMLLRPFHVPLPPLARWFGFLLGLVGVLLAHYTLQALGDNLTDTVTTRPQQTLVTHGPYRWVRHPYYSAFFLLIVATSLLAANWLLAASGLVVFILLVRRVPVEEKFLVDRFGEDYRTYRRQTGGLVPRLGPITHSNSDPKPPSNSN
jgi:protein-S-isoprenylcysteine O-methyltransferase Ste14